MTHLRLALVILSFFFLLGCGAVASKKVVFQGVPPPVVRGTTNGVLFPECVVEAKSLSRWSLTPPIFKMVVHNSTAAYLLMRVNGCKVVDRDTEGRLWQVYLLPGEEKTLDFYSFVFADVTFSANAYCPIPPSFQPGQSPPFAPIPGANPPTPAGASALTCVEGQLLGTIVGQRFTITPGSGRYRVETWEVNNLRGLQTNIF